MIVKQSIILHRKMNMLLTNMLEGLDIGHGQYMFIMELYGNEGINMTTLSRQIDIDIANTTRAIKKLKENGYVRVDVSEEDRRSQKMYLTQKGKDMRNKLVECVDEMNRVLLEGLDEEKRQMLFELLDTVTQNAINKLKEGKK